MNKITEADIMRILDTHETLEQSLKLRLEQALTERRDVMNEVEISFIKAHDYSLEKLSDSYHISDPVYDIYIKMQNKNVKERAEILEREIDDLRDKLAEVTRVCTVYHRLVSIVPTAYFIMNELHYMPIAERRYSWRTLTLELKRSKRYISDGMNLIVYMIEILYSSDHGTGEFGYLTDTEIIELLTKDGKLSKGISNY